MLDPLLSPIDIKLSNPYRKHMVHKFFQYFIASQLPVTNILFDNSKFLRSFWKWNFKNSNWEVRSSWTMDQIWAIFNSIYNTGKIPIGILKEFLLTRNDNLSTDVVSTELLKSSCWKSIDNLGILQYLWLEFWLQKQSTLCNISDNHNFKGLKNTALLRINFLYTLWKT